MQYIAKRRERVRVSGVKARLCSLAAGGGQRASRAAAAAFADGWHCAHTSVLSVWPSSGR